MNVAIVVALLLVASAGTAVALSREPVRQALVLCGYGLLLTVLFVLLQAPDVALAQVSVGSAVVPLMVMLALRARERRE